MALLDVALAMSSKRRLALPTGPAVLLQHPYSVYRIVETPSSWTPYHRLMARRIVVKFGTSVLTGGTRQLDRARMVDLVRQCHELRERGVELTLCTSGAIAAGQERLGFQERPTSLPEKQMLAAVGQSRLMEIWEQLFRLYDIHVGQILLTREDIGNRHRYLNARDTLRELLRHGIVPIVNENDAVATAEIKVGDNDVLSLRSPGGSRAPDHPHRPGGPLHR